MTTVGILGGGQLARMLALAGHPLGLKFRVLDPSPNPPAAAVADVVRGEFEDAAALARFADGIEVATCEIEHVPDYALETVWRWTRLCPGSEAIRVARDRLCEKRFIRGRGIDTAEFASVDSPEDLDHAIARLGLPLLLKVRTNGYDGRGQVFVTDREQARRALLELGGRGLIAESRVDFDRELSALVVRSRGGEVRLYPVVENHHSDGVLRWTVAPAPNVDGPLLARVHEIARELVEALDYVGVLAIELFQVGDRVLVNELAPRVHNSGHWTIEGVESSQFENHLRAILGLALGETTTTDGWVMFNMLGVVSDTRRILELPGAHLHLYGKSPRPGRKLGHINCRVSDPKMDRPRLQELLGLS